MISDAADRSNQAAAVVLQGLSQPHDRIVHGSWRRELLASPHAVENLGTYRPGDKGSPINLNMERVDYWLKSGALPTNTMRAMINKARRSAAAQSEA